MITVTTADPPLEDLRWAREHDIPLLKGSLPGLRALAARLDHEARLPGAARRARRRRRSPAPGRWPSSTRPRSRAATASPMSAASAAATPTRRSPRPSEIGYPVVVKVDNVAHKARVGGVALNLTDGGAVRSAAERMGGRVIVAEQASGGVEVLVGAVRDADYGADRRRRRRRRRWPSSSTSSPPASRRSTPPARSA